jgi:hypothetical protein
LLATQFAESKESDSFGLVLYLPSYYEYTPIKKATSKGGFFLKLVGIRHPRIIISPFAIKGFGGLVFILFLNTP